MVRVTGVSHRGIGSSGFGFTAIGKRVTAVGDTSA